MNTDPLRRKQDKRVFVSFDERDRNAELRFRLPID